MGLKVPWNQTCKLIDPIRYCQANNRKLIVEGLTFQIILKKKLMRDVLEIIKLFSNDGPLKLISYKNQLCTTENVSD